MLICEALSKIRIKTPDGIEIISAGKVFETSNINAANFLVTNSKIKILSTKIKNPSAEQSPQSPHCLQTLEKQGFSPADIETVKSAKSACGGSSAFNDPGPSDNSNNWNSEMKELIEWFKTAQLPTAPFNLEAHVKILCPKKFFAALEMDIVAGSKSPRAKFGTLQSDLLKLRNLFEKVNQEEKA